MSDAADPIAAVFERYVAAVFDKDVDAFVALYDEDVIVFDLWGTWSYDGLPAWRGMVEAWFGSLATERVAVKFSELRTVVSGDLAFAHASVRYAAVSAEGLESKALNNRLTATLRLKHGAWKILHEHSSAPIDHETTKAIFAR